jgi:hypothetical protein
MKLINDFVTCNVTPIFLSLSLLPHMLSSSICDSPFLPLDSLSLSPIKSLWFISISPKLREHQNISLSWRSDFA